MIAYKPRKNVVINPELDLTYAFSTYDGGLHQMMCIVPTAHLDVFLDMVKSDTEWDLSHFHPIPLNYCISFSLLSTRYTDDFRANTFVIVPSVLVPEFLNMVKPYYKWEVRPYKL